MNIYMTWTSQKGTFAETAIVVYRLLCATKENKLLFSVSVCSKQTEVFCFCFLFAAKKQKLPFSVSSVFRVCIYIRIMETEAWAIFLNPFTICSLCNGSLSFVRLLTKKQKKIIRL
jgi:hypothetical protein